MRVRVGEILWHERQRVLSCDYDSAGRLVTGGSDNNVNVWPCIYVNGRSSFEGDMLDMAYCDAGRGRQLRGGAACQPDQALEERQRGPLRALRRAAGVWRRR
jgi:hypothetical protein